MKKKRFLIPAFAALTALTAMGAGPQLVFESTGGGYDIHKVSDVSRVKFVAGGLEVANVTRPSASVYPYESLDKVTFDTEGAFSGVVDVERDDTPGIRVYPSPAIESVTVIGIGENKYRLCVYATDGRRVIAIDDYSGESIDVSALPSGVYIVAVGPATAKFFKTNR